KALEYYIRSLKIYDTLANREGIATTKNNIATIYSIKGDYGPAMKYFEESYSQFAELNDEPRLVGSLNNLGNLYIDLQLYDKASEYLQRAHQLSEKLGQPIADPVNNLGNVFFRQGNYQRAIEYYQKAMEIENEENDRLGMLGTLTNIGIAFTKARQPGPAMQYLNEARAMANELQVYRVLPDILRNIAENQYRLGDVKTAYQTLVKYDSAREKVYGEESSRNIAQMEVALSLQEKEKEYEILKKEAEIKSLALSNTRLFITLMVLVALVVLATINFYYAGRRKKIMNK
ncbi:MAG TPA: tetratricopeptide repeat protein, partial [Cyclobacteriaceae bacterium]|nr:tetratricopeptide repeat protein [Cyclobacteriaceae bacterium]